MDDTWINNTIAGIIRYSYPYDAWWTCESKQSIKIVVARRYADDPVRQGEFLKNLRATKEDMTTFDLLTLDARAWCVAFLKTEGKWKEGER